MKQPNGNKLFHPTDFAKTIPGRMNTIRKCAYVSGVQVNFSPIMTEELLQLATEET